jgi:hypothetical protein
MISRRPEYRKVLFPDTVESKVSKTTLRAILHNRKRNHIMLIGFWQMLPSSAAVIITGLNNTEKSTI